MKKFTIKERKLLHGGSIFIVKRKDLWGRILLFNSVNYEADGFYCEFGSLQEAKNYVEYHSNSKEKTIL